MFREKLPSKLNRRPRHRGAQEAMMTLQPKLDLSPPVSDEIRKTTCYMCACRCGINVHLTSGRVSYIEGNRCLLYTSRCV